MKNLLVLSILTLALCGFSGAQQTCHTDSDCGAGYTSCDTSITGGTNGTCLTTQNDPLNCGTRGTECGEAYTCTSGRCTCLYLDICGASPGDHAPNQNSTVKPRHFVLKLRRDSVTAAVRKLSQ